MKSISELKEEKQQQIKDNQLAEGKKWENKKMNMGMFDHLQKRFEKPTTKANSERASLIEPFVTRLNNSRVAGGYKPYSAGFVASKMSHIPTDELDQHYKMLDNSKNFSALWHWYNTPKKK